MLIKLDSSISMIIQWQIIFQLLISKWIYKGILKNFLGCKVHQGYLKEFKDQIKVKQNEKLVIMF